MSRAFGDVNRIYALVTTSFVRGNFFGATRFFRRGPLHYHPGRARIVCGLIVRLSWSTSHRCSSVTSDTPHDTSCVPSPPIGWKAYIQQRNLQYAKPDAWCFGG